MQKVATDARGVLLQLHLMGRLQKVERMDLTFQLHEAEGGGGGGGRYKKRNHIIYDAPCTKEIAPIQSAGEERFTRSLYCCQLKARASAPMRLRGCNEL